ncbi:MAG: AAA family ATPase, partial [Nanoarchaeota archaeon]|nr:AAA family ATPase [Nanoarchaeota archaeon]
MNKELRKQYEIPKEKLKRQYFQKETDSFEFQATDEISVDSGLETIIGQDKAIGSINHGLKMHDKYNNIFVTGSTETDRDSILRQIITKYIEELPEAEYKAKLAARKDLVAVHNPEEPNKPTVLELPF